MAQKDSVSLNEVKRMLNKRRGDWATIAAEAGISYSWISKFVNGHIDNPGHKNLRELRDYLLKTAEKAGA